MTARIGLREPHIVTLAFAAAVSPMAMNVYLPSLDSMARYFDTTALMVQLSVSVFLAATAIVQIIVGPLSDYYGRRPIMLASMGIMLAATLVCIFAPTIEILLLGRALQAGGAAGLVLSRAIARDLRSGTQAASLIGYITMGMTLAPMLAPVAGGYLGEHFGWQASFWLIFLFAGLVLVILWFDLSETAPNPGRAGGFAAYVAAWPRLLRSSAFWGYCLTCAFSSGAFFVYLGAGPVVGSIYYGLTPSSFGYFFMLIAIGYLLGNFLAGRFSTRIGIVPMMMIGNLIGIAGILISLGLALLANENALNFFGLMFFVGLGNGITLPNANAGMVNVQPELAGAASGLGAAMQTGGGATFAGLAAIFILPENGPVATLVFILTSLLCAVAASVYVALWEC